MYGQGTIFCSTTVVVKHSVTSLKAPSGQHGDYKQSCVDLLARGGWYRLVLGTLTEMPVYWIENLTFSYCIERKIFVFFL